MGKKGRWFSAIKKVFSPTCKDKSVAEQEKKNLREKKKFRGILGSGETKSFIPLFREPSSIEKILGEADEQKLLVRPPITSEQPKRPPPLPSKPDSPRVSFSRLTSSGSVSPICGSRNASPRAGSPKSASPKTLSPKIHPPQATSPRPAQHKKEIVCAYREPSQKSQEVAATRIQAAYRGYVARKSFRALRGLMRLQGVVRGQNVKRQTVSALRSMQMLVRVQSQIQSRRIQMLENQALQHQACKLEKDVESTLSKWTQTSETGQEEWDDSLLKKGEAEVRLQKKVDAVIKRERALSYAYSHQLWRRNPKSATTGIRTRGFPWWWAWLERQLSAGATNVSDQSTAKNGQQSMPAGPGLENKPSPKSHSGNYQQRISGFDSHEVASTRSLKSPAPRLRKKPMYTPSRMSPANSTSAVMNFSKARASAADSTGFETPIRDDDSLVSCPPFSVPNYMSPTLSAKAKARMVGSPREIFNSGTPTSESKRRFSFPPTPNSGSSRLNKGSVKDSTSQMVMEKHQSLPSTGGLSVDSTVSMPAALGRKPFNRFV